MSDNIEVANEIKDINEYTESQEITDGTEEVVVEDTKITESETICECEDKSKKVEEKSLFNVESYSSDFKSMLQEVQTDLNSYVLKLKDINPDNEIDFEFLSQKISSVINEYFIIKNTDFKYKAEVKVFNYKNNNVCGFDLIPLNKNSFIKLGEIFDIDEFFWTDENGMSKYSVESITLTNKELINIVNKLSKLKDVPSKVIIRSIIRDSDVLKQIIINGIKSEI